MVGLVLGSIRMPAMIGMLKMEPKVTIGTNLAASSIMGAAGLAGHLLNGNVDFLVLGVMGSTAMIGGYIGAKYTNRFSANALRLLIGIVLIFVALIMFLRAHPKNTSVKTVTVKCRQGYETKMGMDGI